MHVLLLSSSRSGFSRGENLLKVKGKKENEGRVHIIEKCRSDQSIYLEGSNFFLHPKLGFKSLVNSGNNHRTFVSKEVIFKPRLMFFSDSSEKFLSTLS